MRIAQISISIMVLALLVSCKPDSKPENRNPNPADCPKLEKIFGKISQLESALDDATFDWKEIRPLAEEVTAGISASMSVTNNECLFINHRAYPLKERFSFVDPLTRAIISHNESEGLVYLLNLRRTFKEDPEISEFFGEELGQIAMEAPGAYLEFLKSYPEEAGQTLASTLWPSSAIDSSIAIFRELGGDIVVDHLNTVPDRL